VLDPRGQQTPGNRRCTTNDNGSHRGPTGGHAGLVAPAAVRYAACTLANGIQELLGHGGVKTTMIYTHVLNRGPAGVRSPVDGL